MASHYKVELGQAIKRRREELGLTQKDLADATHYKEAQTVSRWERGENLPSNLEVVAGALQWTLAEMVAGIEPPNRRVARQFGRSSVDASAQSQLDRIEAKLDALIAAVAGEAVEQELEDAAGQEEQLGDNSEADESDQSEQDEEPPAQDENRP